MATRAPRIGFVLGDPAGIGPELVAKIVADPKQHEGRELIVIGDRRVFDWGARVAGLSLAARLVRDPREAGAFDGGPALVDVPTAAPEELEIGKVTAKSGRAQLDTLHVALDLAKAGKIDGITFAPLNKAAMKAAGSPHEDEHRFFAHELGVTGTFGELNVLEELWTARVTSHVPFRTVADSITPQGVYDAIRFVHASMRRAGYPAPRIGVAALNPHAGDNGMFGDEEPRLIAPGIARAQADGIDADGPVSADIIFVRAKRGRYDAIVTMYHDQGQIATKLLGFERGVTVSGGMPVPITTPAHGTAFDIVGQGKANTGATEQALRIATKMARSQEAVRRSPS